METRAGKKKEVDDLGEDIEDLHFTKGIWDTEDKHPTAACFKLSQKRLLLATRFHLLVKEDYKDT